MKKLFLLCICFWLCGCTISVITTDTHGTTDEDLTDTPSNDVSPSTELNIPAKPL